MCEYCHLSEKGNLLEKNPYYSIIKDGEFYYSIWCEHVPYAGVRTCKRKIHDMKFETQNYLRKMFKPDFVGMDIINGPHLVLKCWRIKKEKK